MTSSYVHSPKSRNSVIPPLWPSHRHTIPPYSPYAAHGTYNTTPRKENTAQSYRILAKSARVYNHRCLRQWKGQVFHNTHHLETLPVDIILMQIFRIPSMMSRLLLWRIFPPSQLNVCAKNPCAKSNSCSLRKPSTIYRRSLHCSLPILSMRRSIHHASRPLL